MPYPNWETYNALDTVFWSDTVYPNGYTYHLFYTNYPTNTVFRNDSNYSGFVAYYINRYIQQNVNQQKMYFDSLRYGQKYISDNVEAISIQSVSIKNDTAQIISMLGGTPQAPVFNNYSAKLQKIDLKLSNMQPEIITQSMSFFAGVICAIAFVLAVKNMRG